MDKKQDIIETARHLFTTYGYKKVSMDNIAAEANVTKRTIYRYFKDKDDLFGYFIMEERNKMRLIIEEVEAKDLSFFDSVHETLYKLLIYRRNSKFLNTIQKEASVLITSPVIRYLKDFEIVTKEYITDKLQKAHHEGKIKDCNIELSAFLILKIYIAMMLEWDMENKPLAEEEITDSLTMLLKTGLFN